MRHPVDLPRGLPRDDPGAELHEARRGSVEGCPRAAAWSGCARSTGCRTSPVVGQDQVVRSFVNRSSGRPPAAKNSKKRRAVLVQLSGSTGGVAAGGRDLATRSASTCSCVPVDVRPKRVACSSYTCSTFVGCSRCRCVS